MNEFAILEVVDALTLSFASTPVPTESTYALIAASDTNFASSDPNVSAATTREEIACVPPFFGRVREVVHSIVVNLPVECEVPPIAAPSIVPPSMSAVSATSESILAVPLI